MNWSGSLLSPSFWGLVAVVVIMGLYGWGMARFEEKMRRELAIAEPAARALQELYAPMLKRAERDIKDGRLRSMEDIKNMFALKMEDRR